MTTVLPARKEEAVVSRADQNDSLCLPVAERFVSINGEGLRSGRLAAFIRFAGCNLACSWCDTAWAIPGNCSHEDVSVDELVEWVAQTGASCVTLTGGEPALQPALPELIEALCTAKSWGMEASERVIEIETNGAIDLDELDALRRMVEHGISDTPAYVCFTLDCKLPSSGMANRMVTSNYRLLRPGDAVKFVVSSREDLERACAMIVEHALCDRSEVLLSPVSGVIDPAEIVSFMRERGLSRVRLQLQLHKIIWPLVERGV